MRPALLAYDKAMGQNLEPKKVMEVFINAARRGAESTIDMIAKKGRAMRLGENGQ